MAENTNTERDALDVAMSKACVKAWDSSEYTTGQCDAVHPMFAKAFEDGYRASLSLPAAGQEPVAWQYRSAHDKGAWFDCTEERAKSRAEHPDRWDVRYLYAAPQPAVAAGWVPIETAPKDGRLILVHFKVKGVRAVSWDSPFHDEVTEENGIWCVDDDKHGPYCLRGYNDEGPTAPTHWMPLPPAPSTEGESNG